MSLKPALKPEDYAFTVEVGVPYDVYYFKKDGIDGTIAFCVKHPDGKPLVEIAVFCAGRKTMAEVEKMILEDHHEQTH